MERRGIACGGNFIIDHVKLVDVWPEEGMLSIILNEKRANGGCPYNVLKDLAILKTNLPLSAIGIVGNDEDGEFILNDLSSLNIDTTLMYRSKEEPTSYTDVMTVRSTGRRTFFHNKGANKLLDIEHFDFSKIEAKILHVGYILLLDSLDAPDDQYGTRLAHLLKIAKENGLKTSTDVVSESSDRFNKLVTPALKYTDYLIFNEIEAGKTTGYEIREKSGNLNADNLKKALDYLMENSKSEIICIHFPEGAYGAKRGENPIFTPTHNLSQEYIKGTVGAGDAFCAGMLYGIHEEWEMEKSMRFANAMAAICLSDTSTSGGMKNFEETLKFMEETPLEKRKIFP